MHTSVVCGTNGILRRRRDDLKRRASKTYKKPYTVRNRFVRRRNAVRDEIVETRRILQNFKRD